MKVVAGCDGGGTKCHVRVAIVDDAGSNIRSSEAIAGPANVRSDAELALQNIKQATTEAFSKLGFPSDKKIEIMVAALAGAGQPETQRQWQSLLATQLPVASVSVVPDAAILFAAAGITDAAIATVIGTGSIAWARDKEGNLARAGGLGPELGDEGSARWIGLQAIKAAISNNPVSKSLRAALQLHFKGAGITKQFPGFVGEHRSIASCASIVFAQAASGNAIAQAIINDAAEHISTLLLVATRQISRPVGSDLPTKSTTRSAQPTLRNFDGRIEMRRHELDWICAGGVALHQPAFLQDIRGRCDIQGLRLTAPALVNKPVCGALQIAIDSLKRRDIS